MPRDRLITKYTCAHNGRAALVHYNARAQQYRVQFYKDGVTDSDNDYVATDRHTANDMAERYCFPR